MSIEKTDVPPNSIEIVLRGKQDFGLNTDSVESYRNPNMVIVAPSEIWMCEHVILIGEEGNVVYKHIINTVF
ncbi:MAG: hypothetical protein ACI358_07890 [Candidatus Limimorpha sp.]